MDKVFVGLIGNKMMIFVIFDKITNIFYSVKKQKILLKIEVVCYIIFLGLLCRIFGELF